MKYLVIQGSCQNEFDSLADAKQFVAQLDAEFVLTNDNPDNKDGYRCRYLWGGHREGVEVFILETGQVA